MIQFLSSHRRHHLFVWFFVIIVPATILVELHHGGVFVEGHGCPAFTISDSASRAEVLMLADTLFPSSLKSIVEEYPEDGDNSTMLTGVYDCHHEEGDNEVGVAAICEPGDDGECTCVALYNFVPCQSCVIDCYDDDDLSSRKNITINSFKADCSNVIGNGLTMEDQCKVGCRFDTTGCFASQGGGAAMNVTTPSTTTNMTMGGGGEDKGGDDKGGDDKGGDDKNGTMTTTTTASSPTLSPVVATAPTMTTTTTTTSGSGTIPTVTKPAASAGSVGRTAVGTATTTMAVVLVGTTAAGLLF